MLSFMAWLGVLKASDFASFRDARAKEGAAAATIRLELAVISNLFNVARKEWSFEGLANPIEAMRLPTAKNARNRLFLNDERGLLLRALEPAQRKGNGHLSTGCGNSFMRPLVVLALATAMRRGEGRRTGVEALLHGERPAAAYVDRG